MLFRRSTIFHVEESIPDPEELKLRFRRRILLCASLGFIGVLGAPVARDLRPNLHARAEVRRFAERLLEARTLAAEERAPIALDLGSDKQSWTQLNFTAGETCGVEAPGPTSKFVSEGFNWRLQAKQENGTPLSGHRICWQPDRGLLLDSTPLNDGNLLVTLSAPAEEGGPEQDFASVLITQGGAELQTISY